MQATDVTDPQDVAPAATPAPAPADIPSPAPADPPPAADATPASPAAADTDAAVADVIRAAIDAPGPLLPEDDDAPTAEGDKPAESPATEAPADAKPADAKDAEPEKAPEPEEDAAKILAAKAESFDKLQGFIRDNGMQPDDVQAGVMIVKSFRDARLRPDEVRAGVEIMALANHDPATALAKIQPFIEAWRQAAGHVVPEDLQARVNDGYIAEEDAAREAKLRAEHQRLSRIAEERQQAQWQEQARASAQNTLHQWDLEQRAADPDYLHKAAALQDVLKPMLVAHASAGGDLSPAAVRAVCDRAMAAVNAMATRLRPAPKAVEPPPTTTYRAPPAQPGSLEDAIRAALSMG